MSTATDEPTEVEEAAHDEHDAHEHPSDNQYIMIAVLLAAITAAEVATYFVDIGQALIPVLVVMMIAKFAIVAGYFMHLKFDDLLLRQAFVFGIVLAVIVYIIMLTAFRFWIT